MKFIKMLIVCGLPLLLAGCQTLASKNTTGVIVARRAQIRSSTAVVAADLLQVNRGDEIEILDSADVNDPSDNTRKERWLRVKARDEDATEGWIEARNVMPEDVLEAAKKLEAEDKEIPAQATGQLRASSNLRLTPDRTGNENIMMRLDSGSSFDIVSWKRVPKPKSSEAIETDVAPKAGSAQQGNARAGRQADDRDRDRKDDEVEETNELWYKVRLSTAASPAPAGWIYGKQVELAVPSDIIFYRTGREFVAWQRLDGESKSATDKDGAREARPGSWLILEKSSSNQPRTLDEPDFDRIYVLGYDKRNQEHYTAYRSPDLRGYLPAKVEGQGEDKTFVVRVQETEGGEVKEVRYSLYKDARGVLKINAPNIAPSRRRR
ncbi:MAG TPA: hypothetical protein VJT15_04175 [Pyrinomonadaceae bacterium]|nr:hypothetical protein [Pyrinomonadaceae bacterium]